MKVHPCGHLCCGTQSVGRKFGKTEVLCSCKRLNPLCNTCPVTISKHITPSNPLNCILTSLAREKTNGRGARGCGEMDERGAGDEPVLLDAVVVARRAGDGGESPGGGGGGGVRVPAVARAAT